MNDRDVRKKDRRKHRKVEHENVKWYGKKEWLNEKEKMRDRDDDNEIGKKEITKAKQKEGNEEIIIVKKSNEK